MNTVQRRRYSRIRFHGEAFLQASNCQQACEILDLSLCGALVAVDFPNLAVDTPCLLELRLDNDICVRMDGHVAHCRGTQIGIVCDGTDLDSISHLRRLLSLNLGDACLLEREFSAMLAAHT
ncbi:MAG: PilZ domain-containing protein [Azoarcus sp.]|nr:PilZ domain-containing protein [Azoarcus sp.]